MNETLVADPSDARTHRVPATLSYLSILWLIPTFGSRKSRFSLFHANQGALLTATSVLGLLAMGLLGMIPFVRTLLFALQPLFGITVLVLMLVGMSNAWSGKMRPLPLIGKLATLVRPEGGFASAKELEADLQQLDAPQAKETGGCTPSEL